MKKVNKEFLLEMSNIEFDVSQEEFDELMAFIKKIKEVDVDEEEEYSVYPWTPNLQMVADKCHSTDLCESTFKKNEDGFFETDKIYNAR